MLLFKMHSLFSLAFVHGLASVCLAVVLPPIDTLSIESLGLHKTRADFGTMPEKGFEIRVVHWGPKLQTTRCFINAVIAMANMALRQIHGLMGETVFTMEDQPGVAISVLPFNWHLGGQMPRKYAVWGLFLAIYTMVKKANFQCNTIHLLWKRREVGTINFSRGVVRQPQPDKLESNDPRSEGLLSVDSITSTILPLPLPHLQNSTGSLKIGPELSLDVELLDTIIPIHNVFVTVLGGLMDLAHFDDKDAAVLAMIFDTMPVPTYLSFTTWDTPSKAEPPYMTNRHVIEALAFLPQYMYEQRKFSEADVTVKLDNVRCGLGLLRKWGHLGGVSRGALNVTTA